MDVIKNLWNQISTFAIEYIVEPIKTMGWLDVLDVLLLGIVFYGFYCFCRNRRAGRLLLGLALVVAFILLVELVELTALRFIARLFLSAAFFCIVVVFQPEIRDALEYLGNSRLFNPRSHTVSHKKLSLVREVVDETTDAVFHMAKNKTGALIVFEGLTKLGDYTKTGKPMDAAISSALLQNIFFKNAPLHDGALVIRNLRIHAASCVLPSTQGNMGHSNMGTRHRAAIGVTELSDALVVVVSEQTGVVSVAQNGKLLRDVDEETLKDILMTYIAGDAYLRQKRANTRLNYLKIMDNIGKIEVLSKSQKPKTVVPTPTVTQSKPTVAPEAPVAEENDDAVAEESFSETQEKPIDTENTDQTV